MCVINSNYISPRVSVHYSGSCRHLSTVAFPSMQQLLCLRSFTAGDCDAHFRSDSKCNCDKMGTEPN